MAMIKVVCGVIYKGDKVFIARRRSDKSLGGYWEFPGGKIESGETEQESLTRELKEELGMDVRIGDYLTSTTHHYESFCIELIAYNCTFIRATYELTDHDLHKWIDIENLVDWQLAPADIPIAKLVVNGT